MFDWQIDNVSNNNRLLVVKRLDICECHSRSRYMLHVTYYANKENFYMIWYYERIGNEKENMEKYTLLSSNL